MHPEWEACMCLVEDFRPQGSPEMVPDPETELSITLNNSKPIGSFVPIFGPHMPQAWEIFSMTSILTFGLKSGNEVKFSFFTKRISLARFRAHFLRFRPEICHTHWKTKNLRRIRYLAIPDRKCLSGGHFSEIFQKCRC